MKNVYCSILVILALMLVIAAPGLGADSYPSKPINVYIGYGGGGGTDLTARLLTQIAQDDFKKPLVAINKPGGASVLMHQMVSTAKPDGYTLGILMSAALTRIPYLRDVPYNPDEDFTPIMQYAAYQYGLCVKADSPIKTFKEFIEYAKKNPNTVTYSSTGTGSGNHLALEYLAQKEGLKMTHIPYQGGVAAVQALLGGHVVAGSLTTEMNQFVKSGQLRLLAVYGEERMKAFPEVRTLKEMGYDFSVAAGLGLVGPAGMPEELVQELEQKFLKASDSKEFQGLLAKLELLPVRRDSKELQKFLVRDAKEKRELIKNLKMGKFAE